MSEQGARLTDIQRTNYLATRDFVSQQSNRKVRSTRIDVMDAVLMLADGGSAISASLQQMERERDEAREQLASAVAHQDRNMRLALGWQRKAEAAEAMLTQAIANLQALEAEMRAEVPHVDRHTEVQCWVDKLGTAIADLQKVT